MQSAENKLVVRSKNKSGEWDTVDYVELNEDELKKEWICVRTQFQLKYSVEDASKYREQLIQLLQTTRSKVCDTNKPILKVCGTEIILKKDKCLIGIGKNAKLSAAVQQTKTDKKSCCESNSNQFETLNILLAPGDEDTSIDDISRAFSSKSSTYLITSIRIEYF